MEEWVPSPDGVLPGGKTGHNRTLIGPGPSDADNGKPGICTGSGVGKKKKQKKKC